MFFRLNNFYNIYYDKKQKTKKLQSQALKGAWVMTAWSRDQVLQRADFPMFFKPHSAVHSFHFAAFQNHAVSILFQMRHA